MNNPAGRALLVEDDPSMRRLLENILQARNFEVTACQDGKSAWDIFQKASFPLVILDLNLPGLDGLQICKNIRAEPHGLYSVILVVTARDKPEDLQAVLDAGADDYLPKPIDLKLLKIRLAIAERRVRDRTALFWATEKIAVLEEQSKTRNSFEGLIGKSEPMQEVFRRIRLAAESNVTVLLLGESGTGKELAARAIHSLSARKTKPFMGINCAAIPETLLESELFGHVKGAFTGAVRDKDGVFQAASGGTLFLDEVGDLTPALQVKLLRVLQEQEIQRVGDPRPMKIDVRLITATNKNLPNLLASNTLRDDFYYRIRVFEILLPPLRDRRADVPLLAEYFVSHFSREYQKPVTGIDPEAARRLAEYSWPGNIRELKNVIERAFVTLQGDHLTPDAVPSEIAHPSARGIEKPVLDQRQAEQKRMIDALQAAGGNQSKAAKSLGISRVTLWKKIRQFNIRIKESQTHREDQPGGPV